MGDTNFEGFSPEELDAVLEKLDREGDRDEEPEKGEEGAKQAEEPKADDRSAKLEDAIQRLSTELEAQKRESAQSMGVVGQLMEQLKGSKSSAPAPPGDTVSPEDKRAALEFALKHSPDLLPKLLEKDLEGMTKRQLAAFEKQMEKKSRIRDLGQALSSGVLSHYGDEISKPDSALIRKAAQMKRELAGILDSDVVDSDLHDKLAIAMAAAASPDEVAKIHGSKQQAAESARNEAMERLSELFVTRGGGGGYSRSEPEITDEDREIAEAWDMDLDDEDTRKEILARKRRAEDTYVAQNKVLGR